MVVTEKDFDQYRNNNQLMVTYLASLMMVKTVLFIGYSLDDPDVRSVWSIIYEKLEKLRRQAYCFTNATPSSSTTRKFEMRGIKVIRIGKQINWINVFDELQQTWQARRSGFHE